MILEMNLWNFDLSFWITSCAWRWSLTCVYFWKKTFVDDSEDTNSFLVGTFATLRSEIFTLKPSARSKTPKSSMTLSWKFECDCDWECDCDCEPSCANALLSSSCAVMEFIAICVVPLSKDDPINGPIFKLLSSRFSQFETAHLKLNQLEQQTFGSGQKRCKAICQLHWI